MACNYIYKVLLTLTLDILYIVSFVDDELLQIFYYSLQENHLNSLIYFLYILVPKKGFRNKNGKKHQNTY